MATRDAVLAALVGAEGFISGEAIARELGISRVAVAKHVESMRAEGYAIESRKAAGYKLLHAPHDAVPAGIAGLLGSEFWVNVQGGPTTGSTNDDARALARQGAAEGTVVVAASQSGGKGRLGRSWESPVGGAYMSAILRPAVAPADITTLGLAIGIGVARAMRATGVDVRLKWPNDVLLGGRKLAGILLEMSAETDRVEWVVAGIGLNVSRGDRAMPEAAYVSDTTDGVTPALAAARTLDEVAAAYAEWQRTGFAPMRAEYERFSALTGTAVTVRDVSGTVLAEGVCEGTDDDGRLLVRETQGIRRLSVGDVTLKA